MRTVLYLCLSILGLALCCIVAITLVHKNAVSPASSQSAPAAASISGSAAVNGDGTATSTAGTELAGWGLAIDPDKDCKFTTGPRSLTIDVPAAWHDLVGAELFPTPKLNAPRVLHEVDGEFVLTVKVSGDFKPRSPSTSYHGRTSPVNHAGILLWSDSDNFIRLERCSKMNHDRTLVTYFNLEKREYGNSRHLFGERIKEGDCYLRLERKGSEFLTALSSDGIAWNQLKPIEIVSPSKLKTIAAGLPAYIRTDNVWPNKLKVGLAAINTSSDPFSVKFEQIDLKTEGSQ